MLLVSNAKKGYIIILLTMTILILSFTAVLTFFSSAVQEYRSAQNEGNRVKAIFLAQSGTQVVLNLFNELDQYGYLENPIPIPIGGGFVSFITEDLSGKINVNNLISPFNNIKDNRTYDRLKNLSLRLGFTGDIWDGVVDWIDENDSPEPLGYEKRHYEGLIPPRRIKNTWMSSLEELLLIPGFDRNLLYSDLRSEADKSRFGDNNLTTTEQEVIKNEDFILYNNLIAENYDRTNNDYDRININVAPFLVIRSICEQLNDDNLVKRILVKRRDKKELRQKLTREDLLALPGFPVIFRTDPNFFDTCGIKFEGDLYRITGIANVGKQSAQVVILYNRLTQKLISYNE